MVGISHLFKVPSVVSCGFSKIIFDVVVDAGRLSMKLRLRCFGFGGGAPKIFRFGLNAKSNVLCPSMNVNYWADYLRTTSHA